MDIRRGLSMLYEEGRKTRLSDNGQLRVRSSDVSLPIRILSGVGCYRVSAIPTWIGKRKVPLVAGVEYLVVLEPGGGHL